MTAEVVGILLEEAIIIWAKYAGHLWKHLKQLAKPVCNCIWKISHATSFKHIL